jgi:small subunit ribosomal protein S16
MPTKIRLQRFGKKAKAFYHIVIADSRSPRDGRFIEKIGTYNPNTNPATIDMDFNRALEWYQKGAEPTETCRAILSYKGILMKDHLLRGVSKGALTVEQAEAKFEKWLESKSQKIELKISSLSEKKQKEFKARMAAEAKVAANRLTAKQAQQEAAPAEEEAQNTSEETSAE